MPLLQISEPGAPAPRARRRAAGIDLGTTNSLIAAVVDGAPRVLPDADGRHRLPSAVRYRAGKPPLVGQAALAAQAGTPADAPANTITSAKRLMGRGAREAREAGFAATRFAGPADGKVALFDTAAGPKTPVEVSADILRALKARAEQALGPLDGVVVTVPAYFDDAQRQATRDAARLAGLETLRLLNEPTAAAVAYGLDRDAAGTVAVYDLGGGTFDVSVLRMDKGVFQVLASGGDTALGGDDFDRLIARELARRAGLEDAPEDAPEDAAQDAAHWPALRAAARALKEELSAAPQASCRLATGRGEVEVSLARADVERLTAPLIDKTIAVCRRVLRDAGTAPQAIDEVVLVGGSTRMPQVRARVAALFGRPPLTGVDPDRVVATGAALQADILAGNRADDAALLLDVVSLSLGVETMGGLVERLIPRNTAIPAARAQEFTTHKEGQTGMSLHVVQGERELAADCRSLARFELKGIPPMPAGAARIRVSFQVDADGLLSVEAVESHTGVRAGVEVKPAYGLSEDEVEAMIKDSAAHAQGDFDSRRLREATVEGARVCDALDAALAADADELLAPAERAQIEDARRALGRALEGADADAVRAAIERLENCSEDYVARRMNRGIRKAVRGRALDEFAG